MLQSIKLLPLNEKRPSTQAKIQDNKGYPITMTFRQIFLTLTASLVLAGCASSPPPASLYDRLGGSPAISAVISTTIDKASADPRTKRSFDGVNLADLKKQLLAHHCHAFGGPCK